jgi:hypothetical protein
METDERIKTAKSTARLFAENAIAANIGWALDPRYIVRLLDHIDRLEEAVELLKPFAESDMLGMLETNQASEDSCVRGVCDFTFGDLLAAARFLQESNDAE